MRNKIDIIFEDEFMIVVNKPAGQLAIPGRSAEEGRSLLEQLNKEIGKCFTVHRLDLQTSGVICFAKTPEAHRDLSVQFQERRVQKLYHVIVEGSIPDEEGEIDKGIAPHKAIAGKMAIANKGKKALTLYKVLERFKAFTYLEADIKTGRTHQIRLHFQSIGHQLAIDKMYSRKTELFLSEIKIRKYRKDKMHEERPLMSRSSLHAFQLTVFHPSTRKSMTFEAPLPKDFRAVLNQLRKWGKKKM
jgi:RluA family pseudouridine synthase